MSLKLQGRNPVLEKPEFLYKTTHNREKNFSFSTYFGEIYHQLLSYLNGFLVKIGTK